METDEQSPSGSNDVADESRSNATQSEEKLATNSSENKNSGEIDGEGDVQESAGSSTACQSSATETGAEKGPAKRNYRRRTGNDEDDSSSNDEPDANPTVDTVEGNQPPEASESEDVSLDELRVSASDDENNSSPRRYNENFPRDPKHLHN